ncbi:MAG TPA: Rieske 2Fe-2S domain-containing protein [Acidimicrobiales bacterium]|nr:Rieske 2Fe-2S domain-containing protein [Acidimicrobiales bacterium]
MTSNSSRRVRSAAARSQAQAPAPTTGADSMWTVQRSDGTVATGWVLMPLRLFLGATFLFAGLQKLANPNFLRSSSPASIHAQLAGAARSSPVHGLLSHLLGIAPAVGLLIALGEVAIGVGVLLGLLTRVAAIAGMALSFGLFLTVSFHASPYFTGSDIVFFFAWVPIALAGAGDAPALDTWLAQSRQAGAVGRGGIPRREVLSKGALAGIVAGAVVVGGGLTALLGRMVGGTTTSTNGVGTLAGGGSGPTTTTSQPTATTSAGGGGATTSTTGSRPSGTAVGPASSVPVGGSASFTDPASGDPALVVQQTAGDFVAFDAVCPHAGCTVAYQPSAKIIACPCHGSTFDAATGNVLNGPAATGLTPIKMTKGSNGDLYVQR